MGKRSLVYRNIFIYRLVMNVLYCGKYRRRFDRVISHIKKFPPGSRVLELCFGDTYVANFCKENGYEWTGLDINRDFVQGARKKGFDAHVCDLTTVTTLPTAAACVIVGSLYHFSSQSMNILPIMFNAANTVIISEPVINLSSRTDLIGWVARKAANAGRGHERFRFNKASLVSMLEENSAYLGFRIEDVQDYGRDLIVKLVKDGKH
jgi:hypothetical protein